MNCGRHLGITLTIIISLFLIFSRTAYACIDVGLDWTANTYYLDPGTGSIIIQVLIALVVGGVAMIGVYWTRVKTFLRNLVKKKGNGDSK